MSTRNLAGESRWGARETYKFIHLTFIGLADLPCRSLSGVKLGVFIVHGMAVWC